MKKIILAALLCAFGLVLFPACNSRKESKNSSPKAAVQKMTVVKLGVVGENNEAWDLVKQKLVSQGIDLELVKFSDYTLPNQALSDGDIDLDSFQHIAFLKNDMAQRGFKLSVIGNTSLAPLGVYSKKIKDISQLKDGDKIAIPNDPTNGGRALKLFETAGFITIDPKAGYMPELKDITSNPKHLNFIEVDASQTASLLPDVAASVINSGNAIDNGFIPAKDAIYLEKLTGGSTNPYINVIVARTKDKDSPVYQKIVKAYQTDDVKQLILKDYKGSIIPAW